MTANLITLLRRAAKHDPAVYAREVLRDESTGQRIALADHHREMHALWTAHDRLVLHAFAEGGKSSQLTARIAWELSRDPTLRVSVVGGALSQAEKIVASVARLIESPAARAVFPAAKIDRQAAAGFLMRGRHSSAKDFSCSPSALGLGSSLGGRFDLIVCDDLLDLESTRTPQGREAAWVAFVAVHLSRLAPGGRVWICGTAWHQDDVLERAAKLPGWASARFPVEDRNGPTWPARWPLARIQQRQRELGARTFARVMMCAPLSDASCVFKGEPIATAVRRGAQLQPSFYSPRSGRRVVGVDVAFTSSGTADLSAIVVVRADDNGEREVLEVQTGRWGFDEIVNRAAEAGQRHGAVIYVESNGGGGFVVDALKKKAAARGIPTTAANRTARIEWLSAELEADRWLLHDRTEAERALLAGMLTFSVEDHLPDALSALLVAVEAVRLDEARPRVQFGTFRRGVL